MIVQKQTNPLLDYKFLVLVAISVVCITVVMCLMIPRKERRDLEIELESEDDGYIEPARQQRARPRPTVVDNEEPMQVNTGAVEEGRRGPPLNRAESLTSGRLQEIGVPASLPTANAAAKVARTPPRETSADPMFQPLRK